MVLPRGQDEFYMSPPPGEMDEVDVSPTRGREIMVPPTVFPLGGQATVLSPGPRGESLSFSSTGGKDEFLTCLPPGGRKRENPQERMCGVGSGHFPPPTRRTVYVVLPPGERTEFDVSPPRGEKVFYVVLPQGRGRVLRVSHQGEERKKKPQTCCVVWVPDISVLPSGRSCLFLPRGQDEFYVVLPPRGEDVYLWSSHKAEEEFYVSPTRGKKERISWFLLPPEETGFISSPLGRGIVCLLLPPGGLLRGGEHIILLHRGEGRISYMSPPGGRKRENPRNVCVVWVLDTFLLPRGDITVPIPPQGTGRVLHVSYQGEEETCLFSPLPNGRGTQKCPKRRCGVGSSDFMVLLPPEEDSFFYISPLLRRRDVFSPLPGGADCLSLSLPAEGTVYSLPCCGGETCVSLLSARWRGTQNPQDVGVVCVPAILMVFLPGRDESV